MWWRFRLLDRIAGLLGAEEADPDRMVEIASVSPFEATVLREFLMQRGINCHESKRLVPGTWQEKSFLAVRHGDLESTNMALVEFRNH